MTPREFFISVMHMRSWQNQYFKTRSKTALNEARKYEKMIDKEILRVKTQCPNDKDINPVQSVPPQLPL